ncbi:MAG: hypothetical protein AB1758_33135, partial [Candidatus Eremiobacterota bacterium]
MITSITQSAPRRFFFTRPLTAASAEPAVQDTAEVSAAAPGMTPAQVQGHARDARKVSVLIAGAGNAGLTAAVYTARAQLETLVVGSSWGSQLAQSSEVENFPGFARSTGMEVVEAQRKQAEAAGAKFHEGGQIVRIEGD